MEASMRRMIVKLAAVLVATTMLTALPARAEMTVDCQGYSILYTRSKLETHNTAKPRTYPVTHVDQQDNQTVVTGKTRYGKVTVTFAKDGRNAVVWINKKGDVVLNQCGVPDDTAMLNNQPPMPAPPSGVKPDQIQCEQETQGLVTFWHLVHNGDEAVAKAVLTQHGVSKDEAVNQIRAAQRLDLQQYKDWWLHFYCGRPLVKEQQAAPAHPTQCETLKQGALEFWELVHSGRSVFAMHQLTDHGTTKSDAALLASIADHYSSQEEFGELQYNMCIKPSPLWNPPAYIGE
jgi:hypothetical protein